MPPDTTQPAAIECQVSDGIATLLLNRPEVRNAIDDAMRAELIGILDRLGSDDAIRAMVITGKGKAFCAGGDIAGMQRAAEGAARRGRLQRLAAPAAHPSGHRRPAHAAASRPSPRSTAPAMGLGCDMALCCDFIIASEAASFAMSFIQRGLVPDGGGMYFLPRRVGLPRAKELIFTGRSVERRRRRWRSASPTAWPAPTRCWPRPGPGPSSSAAARPRRWRSPSRSWTRPSSCPRSRSSLAASEAQAICYTTREHHESVAAFLSKTSRSGGPRPWTRSIACSARAASPSSAPRPTRRSCRPAGRPTCRSTASPAPSCR